MRSLPEPMRDVAAQVDAMLNPRSSKDAVFLSPGTPEPASLPASVHRIVRDEGVLLTTNDQKAWLFRSLSELADGHMALLLDYPQSKTEVERDGGEPVVVQGIGRNGGVVYEAAASRGQLQRTARAAQAAVPDGYVRLTTLEDALAERAEEYANGG